MSSMITSYKGGGGGYLLVPIVVWTYWLSSAESHMKIINQEVYDKEVINFTNSSDLQSYSGTITSSAGSDNKKYVFNREIELKHGGVITLQPYGTDQETFTTFSNNSYFGDASFKMGAVSNSYGVGDFGGYMSFSMLSNSSSGSPSDTGASLLPKINGLLNLIGRPYSESASVIGITNAEARLECGYSRAHFLDRNGATNVTKSTPKVTYEIPVPIGGTFKQELAFQKDWTSWTSQNASISVTSNSGPMVLYAWSKFDD